MTRADMSFMVMSLCKRLKAFAATKRPRVYFQVLAAVHQPCCCLFVLEIMESLLVSPESIENFHTLRTLMYDCSHFAEVQICMNLLSFEVKNHENEQVTVRMRTTMFHAGDFS